MSNIDARQGTINNIRGDQINTSHVHFGAPVGYEIERRISNGITAALSGIRFVHGAASQVSTFIPN